MAFKQIDARCDVLTDNADELILSADASSAATTITVQSIKQAAVNQILWIGEPGQEKSEIIKTHASTAPTGTTVTLASALVFDHPQDTKIYIIDYDQVEFSHATTSTASKTVLATSSIEADRKYTSYQDSTYTSGGYFTRFKNSISSAFSSYSDYVPYAGYGDNTVYKIKKRALESLGEERGDLITDEFLNEALYQGRRDLYEYRKRWSFYQKYDQDIGNVSTGDYRVALPSDLSGQNTSKNVYSLKIGVEEPMKLISKPELETYWRNVPRTTLASAYTVGDGTITLTDSRDFDESGTITIDEDDIEYSANNESTGVLTVSTDGDDNHSAADNVYQNASFSLPDKYCIWNGYAYFNYPVDADYLDQNYWMDYYQTIDAVNSDADEVTEGEYDMLVNYLAFQIKKRKNRGEISLEDPDWQEYLRKREELARKEIIDRTIELYPGVNLNQEDN